jgi:hypothetical protein
MYILMQWCFIQIELMQCCFIQIENVSMCTMYILMQCCFIQIENVFMCTMLMERFSLIFLFIFINFQDAPN